MSTATSRRKDVHRPSSMNPADYVCVGDADYHQTEGHQRFDWERYAELTGQPEVSRRDYGDLDGVPWADVEHANGSGGCDHCGQTRIRYWVFYLHVPSGEVVAVGGDCARRLGAESREQFAARADLQRRALAQQLEAWRAEDERNERALDDLLARQNEAGGWGAAGNEFVDSLLRYAHRHGRLSDAQRDAVLRGIERRRERAREREAREAAFADPAPAPVVEGRIEITGRLVALKTCVSRFGEVTKMLVLDDRGFRVWGTFPQALTDPLFERACTDGASGGGIAGWLRGGGHARIRFTATVERSRDDESFGFFKRPAKAAAAS